MVTTGPEKMEMRTFPIPGIGKDDGLLEIELAGVCGSDPGIFRGVSTHGPRPFPLILGHEIVGRVVEIGAAAKERFKVEKGDRVVVEYAIGCGVCDACLGGLYTMCEKKVYYGSMISCQSPPHLYGAYGEYLYLHPRAKVHRIGDDVSPEVGVMICAVIANGIRWLQQIGGAAIGETVVILGPGQQKLAGAAAAREAGAGPIFVVGLDRDKERLETAKRFGADRVINVDRENPVEVIREATGGRMADVVMDVTGHPAGAEMALPLTGRRGRVVLPGLYKRKKASLDLDHVVINEIKMMGAYSQDFRAVRPAIKVAREGRYPWADLITHRFPLAEAERAVRLVGGEVEGEMPGKVVLDPKL
jgi:alcohol dehydrogenase